MRELPVNQVLCGDCREVMPQRIPDKSINFVMFSPPYWGLRDYGIEGQIGLEPTYQEYVAKMVEVGREVRRVLRGDGSWYLNLGDTYASQPTGSRGDGWQREGRTQSDFARRQRDLSNVSAKCKLLIPYRVALALVDDGWICRNDITWYKPNAMPSSVKDRLTCQTERVFHLVKSRKYYYDLDAIREPHKYLNQPPGNIGTEPTRTPAAATNPSKRARPSREDAFDPLGKNPGDVIQGNVQPLINGYTENRTSDFWPITTKPFPEAHFAVYPEALCEKPIKSSCPPDGIVLDPMCGVGTTLKVAKRLGRRYIGIDIKPEYVEMTKRGLSQIEWPLEAFS